MFSTSLLAFVCLAAFASAAPVRIVREVPQEHSHEPILTAVRTSLQLNNPDQIVDPVFALLGNAAAQNGLGKIADPDCLQQAVADQAFTNAKAAGDVDGQVNALIFRALERNTGKVGQTSAACTSIKAKNPEIAAIQQHQDPASTGAAAVNKAITLELAKQIHNVGGDPQLALKSGTFAPGDPNDNTGKGNTCDDANDAAGCIFSQNLLVPDATPEEIDAAVAGDNSNNNASNNNNNSNNNNAADAGSCSPAVTVTVGNAAPAATAASGNKGNNGNAGSGAAASGNANANAASGAASAGGNLQTFTGALGGVTAPPVVPGGKGFVVDNSDFLNIGAALGRSCDVQHNKCANVANSAAGKSQGISVGDCDQQNNQCRAAIGK